MNILPYYIILLYICIRLSTNRLIVINNRLIVIHSYHVLLLDDVLSELQQTLASLYKRLVYLAEAQSDQVLTYIVVVYSRRCIYVQSEYMNQQSI